MGGAQKLIIMEKMLTLHGTAIKLVLDKGLCVELTTVQRLDIKLGFKMNEKDKPHLEILK